MATLRSRLRDRADRRRLSRTTVSRDDIDRLEEQDAELFDTIVEAAIEAEQAFPSEAEVVEIDPEPEQGQVVIRHNGYEFGYAPNGGDDS